MHVEVNFTGFPLGTGFDEERGDESKDGGFVWEKTGDAGAAFEFQIDPFQGVGSSEFELMARGQGKSIEALGDIFLHPGGELGSGGGVTGDDGFEAQEGGGAIRGVEDAPKVGSDGSAQVQAGNVGLGVLLEMKLTALPGDGREDGGASGAQTGMIIADDVGDPLEAAELQAEEEVAPMRFGLAEGDAEAENGAFAEGIDAEGDEDGAIHQTAAVADFFVTGVEHQIGADAEGASAPGIELNVELGGTIADL